MAEILLIEPSRVLAQNYAMALKAANHKVRHYARGQSAIEAADKQAPELVIVELQIPAHNGLEFLYEFRSYTEWQEIPVIIHSVVPPAEVRQAAAMTHLGVKAYLYKPATTLAKLVETVNDILHTVPA